MKSLLDFFTLDQTRSNANMMSSTAACMIDGDFELKNGITKTLTVRTIEGSVREAQFLKYESTVSISKSKTDSGQSSEDRTFFAEVWIPASFFQHHSESAFANLHGRLYMPDTDKKAANSVETSENPIIEAIIAHRYSLDTPEAATDFIAPVVTLIGTVLDSARYREGRTFSRLLIMGSSTFIKGEEKQSKIT